MFPVRYTWKVLLADYEEKYVIIEPIENGMMPAENDIMQLKRKWQTASSGRWLTSIYHSREYLIFIAVIRIITRSRFEEARPMKKVQILDMPRNRPSMISNGPTEPLHRTDADRQLAYL